MAEIVFGAGSSHSPQVSTPADLWPERGEMDRNRSLTFRGERRDFDEVAALRVGENLADEIQPDRQHARHAACQAAIASLSSDVKAAELDVIVVIGDDQNEQLLEDNRPSILLYTGEEIPLRPRTYPPTAKPVDKAAGWSFGEEAAELPGAPGLGEHAVRSMIASGIDVAYSNRLPKERGIGHAFAFVYTRICGEMVIPSLPIMLNTYFVPNQPTAARCVDYGIALGEAIRSWDADARVGVIASGGLTHFVIEEDFDRRVLRAFADSDLDFLRSLPEAYLQDGTSEVKNWLAAAAALDGLQYETIAYEPCYRSLAGTGCAMAFGKWT